MPALAARPADDAAPAPAAPLPTGVLVALGAVVVAAIASVFGYEVLYAKPAPEPAPAAIGTQPPAVGTFSTVPAMIKAHAYGESIDGAGCTCYPLEVMKEPTRAPLECPTCKDQRVRGRGRCVGDDVTGKRLPGVYLCRQILGPKP
jgi:hypothetical protein